ncbi:MAG: BCD family MFS transporter [Sphingomonadaceae bacterium]|nr:BCD family MFS transporter [Sphingomonadaceae bacterium]
MSERLSARAGIGWFGIFRLGTVQAAIGAMVMLATSLLNRVMVVEYAIAAAIPAALVAWHYGVQLSRPLWGHSSDRSAMRSPWIIGGMGLLALGTLVTVDATIMMAGGGVLPVIIAVVGFTLIGLGVGMSGTALLALLASRVMVERKPAAAAISWTMMVAGIVVSAGISGAWLDPFGEARLAIVTSAVALVAFCIAMLALHGLERNGLPVAASSHGKTADFPEVLKEIWRDGKARRFTYFVFISMLAYSMQDLILEPFAGLLFKMTPGESTQLSGIQHSGILVGMLATGVGGSLYTRKFGQNLKLWIVLGCFGSAIMLAGLSAAAVTGTEWPLKANVFGLGLANGIFAVAAVSAMLSLASDGKASGEGARMGVWGAAQAVAFGAGGLIGAVIVDQLRGRMGSDGAAFQAVFAIEAMMFVIAAVVATGTSLTRSSQSGKAVRI